MVFRQSLRNGSAATASEEIAQFLKERTGQWRERQGIPPASYALLLLTDSGNGTGN